MPYRCVHCSEVYEDTSDEVLAGCGNCKGKFFFYIKDEKLQEILAKQEAEPKLSSKEKEQIEKDVREIVGAEDSERPVFLDFESIKIIKPGKYLLDLQKLFAQDRPRIYQLEDGKYIVELTGRLKER